jgi:hypothetical protein
VWVVVAGGDVSWDVIEARGDRTTTYVDGSVVVGELRCGSKGILEWECR